MNILNGKREHIEEQKSWIARKYEDGEGGNSNRQSINRGDSRPSGDILTLV